MSLQNHKIERHHIKYLEIDGKDEIVAVSISEHRKEGWKSRRGLKQKTLLSVINKASHRYHNSNRLCFHQCLGGSIRLNEYIRYDPLVDMLYYNSGFELQNAKRDGRTLKVVYEQN